MAPSAIAIFTGVPSALLLAGYNIACSQAAVPAIQHLPAELKVPAFTKLYMTNLKQFFLPSAATSLVSFGYLGTNAGIRGQTGECIMYCGAAALMLGAGLVTKLVQLPGVERLLEISETDAWEMNKEIEIEAAKLVKRWAAQNWLRVGLAATAGGIGLYAALAHKDTEI